MKRDIYAKDRLCYILEETFNYFVIIMISGSYLAKLTTTLGFSDSLTAILTAFVNLGACAQVVSVAFFKKGMVKRRLTAMFTFSQLLFTLLYVVPFFPVPGQWRTAAFAVLLLAGHLVLNVALAPRTNWYMSFVDNGKRGIFTAKKEAVSLVTGIVFQFALSAVIDVFEAKGNLKGAFVVCGIVILTISVGHTLSLIFTKDREVPESSGSFFGEVQSVLADKGIRPLFVVAAIWAVGSSLSIPFYGTYTIKELGFSMSYIAVMSVLSAVSRIVASVWLGKYADKYSFAKMLGLSYTLAALSFAVAAFMGPENGYYLYPIYTCLHAASLGGTNSAAINLIFDYVRPEKRTVSLSMHKGVYGLVGFLTATVVTPLLNYIQAEGNRFLGVPVYAQQVLSALAFAVTILAVLYLHKAVMKLRPVKTEQE